jgi:ATP-dependent protease HslVU (ClpYQ), ATPase subunit
MLRIGVSISASCWRKLPRCHRRLHSVPPVVAHSWPISITKNNVPLLVSHFTTISEPNDPPTPTNDDKNGTTTDSTDATDNCDQDAPPSTPEPTQSKQNQHPRSQITKLHQNQTPSQIVDSLSQHIVGQTSAKRAVSLAIRNRIRRTYLPRTFLKEVTPRNVLMIRSRRGAVRRRLQGEWQTWHRHHLSKWRRPSLPKLDIMGEMSIPSFGIWSMWGFSRRGN